MMVSKVKNPQVALIQVSELFQFTRNSNFSTSLTFSHLRFRVEDPYEGQRVWRVEEARVGMAQGGVRSVKNGDFRVNKVI